MTGVCRRFLVFLGCRRAGRRWWWVAGPGVREGLIPLSALLLTLAVDLSLIHPRLRIGDIDNNIQASSHPLVFLLPMVFVLQKVSVSASLLFSLCLVLFFLATPEPLSSCLADSCSTTFFGQFRAISILARGAHSSKNTKSR